MSVPVKITRTDLTAAQLRQCADKCEDARQARRLRAVAMIVDGRLRSETAKATGVTLETLRSWVRRYNQHGVDGLRDAHYQEPASNSKPSELEQLSKELLDDPGILTDAEGRFDESNLVKRIMERLAEFYGVDDLVWRDRASRASEGEFGRAPLDALGADRQASSDGDEQCQHHDSHTFCQIWFEDSGRVFRWVLVRSPSAE